MSSVCVSVIIPAFNCAKYIDKAIDSALSQNVCLEVIVIDDNDPASDARKETSELMGKYLKDERVIYILMREITERKYFSKKI